MPELRSPLTLEEFLRDAEEKLSTPESGIEILLRTELMANLVRRVIALEETYAHL